MGNPETLATMDTGRRQKWSQCNTEKWKDEQHEPKTNKTETKLGMNTGAGEE